MIKVLVFLFFVYQICAVPTTTPKPGCMIDPSKRKPEPIVVSSNDYKFLYPEPKATEIALNPGDTVIISCPGSHIKVGSTNLGTTIDAMCSSGTQFTVKKEKNIDFNEIKCSMNPSHIARYTGRSCESNGREIEIGFKFKKNAFARVMLICFDEENLNPLYSTYDLTKSIGHQETGTPRPFFVEDDFYNLNKSVNDLYALKEQKLTINGLLGLPLDSTKYIQDTNDYYLSRGHLTAKADYVYAPQQDATFHYVNAAPQWQTFNGKNWQTAEKDVRDYAEAKELDLRVYTGTYGVAKLPHEQTGEEIPLYLYVAGNETAALPVPELYWKVLYHPETKRGIALLGVNNPYQKEPNIICDDISSNINWLHWNRTNIQFGYCYACTVDDLRTNVTYLPNFEVKGILNDE